MLLLLAFVTQDVPALTVVAVYAETTRCGLGQMGGPAEHT